MLEAHKSLPRTRPQQLSPHLCAGNNVEFQFLVYQAGACLRQVALVQDQAVSPKAARAAQLLQPLGPLGVQLPVWLLILGLEDANDFL